MSNYRNTSIGSHLRKQTFSVAVAGLEVALQDDGGSLLPYIQVVLPFSLPSYPSDLQHFRQLQPEEAPSAKTPLLIYKTLRSHLPIPTGSQFPPTPPALSGVPCGLTDLAAQLP